jgi:hypothetical protein
MDDDREAFGSDGQQHIGFRGVQETKVKGPSRGDGLSALHSIFLGAGRLVRRKRPSLCTHLVPCPLI